MHTWRRYLISLARGLCICSLVLFYLFVNLVLRSGYRTGRTTPSSILQTSLGKEHTGSSSPSAAEEKPSTISDTPHVGFDAPFQTHLHPRFANGRPQVLNAEESANSLVIPKIIVQDFSAEDGLVRCKTPEYDPTHTLKRQRRPSWTRISTPLEDYVTITTRPSFRLPPTSGVPAVGGPRRSDVHVRNLVVFPGRNRTVGDVAAKDGSFVIVGL